MDDLFISAAIPRIDDGASFFFKKNIFQSKSMESISAMTGKVIKIIFIFRSGRISSVYIVGNWLLVVGHTFSKFVYFECCSVVMMVY